MDMTFQEKSAWGLLIGIGLVSYFYFPAAFDIADSVPHGAPLIAISIVGVVALVIFEAIYHACIAIPHGNSAGDGDERDRLINLKAERIGSYALGIGLFWLVGQIIATHSSERLEPMSALTIGVWILFALTASEIAKLIAQIVYYRRDA